MKRKLLFGCLLPLILIVAGVWWGMRALRGAQPAPARYETPARGDIEIKVTETGTIEPLKKVEVKSKVAGRISRLYVQEGDRVSAGQLLAEIDPTEINSQVAQFKAQLAGVRARQEAAQRSVTYQAAQTQASIRQMRENLRVAEARLRVAQEENRSQPALTAGDLAQAQAALKSAQDNLTMLKHSTHPQSIVQAQSGYEEAKAGAETARRNLERQQRLLAKGFVSDQAVDQAKSEMAAATARLDQAKKKLDLIEEQNRLEIAGADNRVAEAQATLDRAQANRSLLTIKTQEVSSAKAAVEQARAQLQAAQSGVLQDRMREDEAKEAKATVMQLVNQLQEIEVRQHDTRLVAPMGGVVTKRYIEQGELVTSGVSTFSSGTPVLQIANLSQMLVKMTVNEVDVHKIRNSLPVEIAIDGVRGVLFSGRVRKVAPAALGGPGEGGPPPGAEGAVIRFAVEVLVNRPDPRLKPGMSARCTIIIARKKDVLRLPNNCVEGEGANARVQVVSTQVKDGKPVDVFTPRPVVIGLRGDSHVEIISGLKVGERVKPGVYTGPKRKAMELNFD